MNDDIVCLLQDLGRDVSVDVIANFIIRNPETEDLIAAKMGSLLATPAQAPASNQNESLDIMSQAASMIPEALSSAFANVGFQQFKMIFVVNMDLNMKRGKQCAQVAHAALGLYLKIQESTNSAEIARLNQWMSMGGRKIVVRGNNLDHIQKVKEEAKSAGLSSYLVTDAGCTQVPPGSRTVLSIFGTNDELEKITGSLRLL